MQLVIQVAFSSVVKNIQLNLYVLTEFNTAGKHEMKDQLIKPPKHTPPHMTNLSAYKA